MRDETKLTCWSDVRDEFMTPQEQIACQQWLNELGTLMDARDAGKISGDEYCRLCFELDKKYGLADEDDADLYNADDEPEYRAHVGENFGGQIAFVGG